MLLHRIRLYLRRKMRCDTAYPQHCHWSKPNTALICNGYHSTNHTSQLIIWWLWSTRHSQFVTSHNSAHSPLIISLTILCYRLISFDIICKSATRQTVQCITIQYSKTYKINTIRYTVTKMCSQFVTKKSVWRVDWHPPSPANLITISRNYSWN